MPQVIPAFVAVVSAVAGAVGGAVTAIASTVGFSGAASLAAGHVAGTFVASLGFTNGLAAGVSALAITASLASAVSGPPHPKVGQANGGTQVDFKADPSAPLPYAIGRTGTGGSIIYTTTTGPKNAELCYLTALSACGPIEAIEAFAANDITITFSRSDPTGDLAVSGLDKDGNPDNRFGNGSSPYLMWDRRQLGDVPSAPFYPPAVDLGDKWTDAHKLSGVAATWWVLGYDQKAYAAGTPKPLWTVKGVKCYDPRLDSTYPGGSGAHRATDRTTWTFSENPYLHGLTWCLGHYTPDGKRMMGVGVPPVAIDMAAYVEGANVADANGWKCGGVVYSTDDKFDVLSTMLQAGGGKPMRLGALISCYVSTPRVSLATMTGADVIGEAVIPAGKARRDRINAVAPRYRSEDHGYELVDAAPIVVADYVTADAGQRTKAVTYALVQDVNQAAELAAYDIVNSREFGPVSLPCKPVWYGYKPGDCITVTEPEFGLNGQLMLIVARDPDTATGAVTLQLISETTAKHDFALGRTTTPPPTPGLTGVDPGYVPTPGVAAGWAIVDNKITTTDGGTFPAIVIEGEPDDPTVSGVIVDYKVESGDSWATEEYPVKPADGATTNRIEIRAVQPVTLYRAKIRYRSARGVEDPAAARDLGTVTTAAFVAGNTLNVGDKTTQQVLDAIAAALAGIASLEAEVAAANAALDAALASLDADVIKQLGLDLEANAQAILERAVDARDTKEYLDALAYIAGQPVGSVIVAEQQRTDTLVHVRNLLGVVSGDGFSFILDDDTVKYEDGTSIAVRQSAISASLAANSAAVTSEASARASADSSLATLVSTLTASVGSNSAAIVTEQTARANGDSALASSISSLAVTVGNNTSAITSEAAVRASADTSIAATVTALTSTVGGNTASITTEAATRASADSALSATVSSLSSTVGTVSSSVTTTAAALATLSGQAYGSYTIKANANGALASMQLLASGGATTTSAVIFDVDKFLLKSSSHPDVTPFYYDATTGALFSDTIIVRSANVLNAWIATAHLGNGQVTEFATPLNSNPALTLTGSDQTVSGSVSVTVPAFNSGVDLSLYAEVSNAANVTGTAIISIYRNGTTFVDAMAVSTKADGLGGIYTCSLPTADSPTAGTHTYTVAARQSPAAGSILARITLRAITLKR